MKSTIPDPAPSPLSSSDLDELERVAAESDRRSARKNVWIGCCSILVGVVCFFILFPDFWAYFFGVFILLGLLSSGRGFAVLLGQDEDDRGSAPGTTQAPDPNTSSPGGGEVAVSVNDDQAELRTPSKLPTVSADSSNKDLPPVVMPSYDDLEEITIEEERRDAIVGIQLMASGAGIFLLGAVLTLGTFLSAASAGGGFYVFAYGALFIGLVNFAIGFEKWNTGRKHQRND